MLIYRNISKLLCKRTNIRCISSIFCSDKYFENKLNNSCRKNVCAIFLNNTGCLLYNVKFVNLQKEGKRHFAKKKGSKRNVEAEEESGSEDEEEYENDEMAENVITKNVPSMRLDTIIKASLGMSKKKIEKCFYADKFRVNGQKVLKKATFVAPGVEVDSVRDYSPENKKFLLVDRVIIKSIDKVTGTGLYPVKMEVLRGLTIENYDEPWSPSSVSEID